MAKKSLGAKSLSAPARVDGLDPRGSLTVKRENPTVSETRQGPENTQEPGTT